MHAQTILALPLLCTIFYPLSDDDTRMSVKTLDKFRVENKSTTDNI